MFLTLTDIKKKSATTKRLNKSKIDSLQTEKTVVNM